MSIQAHFQAVADFLKQIHPDSTVVNHQKPNPLVNACYVIQHRLDGRQVDSNYQMKVERTFVIDYYDTNVDQVLTQMDIVSTQLYQHKMLTVQGSTDKIRIESFAFSIPEDVSDIVCSGVLKVSQLMPFQQPSYSKMENIFTKYNNLKEE
ncbi:hypothetical protein [Longirhabdus pacifica]|uniref:hypothetical protein n=1 Tax=Longirhabdus pacifica TaxID=2305227 RepID=UPI001009004F|nr:hypothetical protein [Longirhabdus pacifica]